jgi:peptidoglycan/xylan/chitin deacetylase (PgdA/CDA1 family)
MAGGVGVLLYHRVSSDVPDPQLLCVQPSNFDAHAEYLRRRFTVIGLEELPEALRKSRRLRRVVVLTFDDGYADNAWNAYPILERHGLPAAVFVVTGHIDQERELVHDAVERLILTSPRLPGEITVRIGETLHSWRLGDEGPQLTAWDVTRRDYPTSRHRCYHDLHRLLRDLDSDGRREVLETLRRAIADPPPPRGSRRIMSSAEIRRLAASGLVTIGAHSRSHLFLAKHSPDTQREEIIASKLHLERIIERPVNTFAYPYGGDEAVDATTRECVRSAGFTLACEGWGRRVRRRTNPLALPRFLVRDWTGEAFAQNMTRIFGE